jgi:ABC-type glycerol-3-phosphate transport system permease component
MKNRKRDDLLIHLVLIIVAALTLIPFVVTINNSFRTNTELYKSLVALPESAKQAVKLTWNQLTGRPERTHLRDAEDFRGQDPSGPGYGGAIRAIWKDATSGYRNAWRELRPYMLNSLIVCVATVGGVVLIGSISAYVFSRYRFPGHKVLFLFVLSFLMIPGILTLVPSFLLVKKLGLLNSYWVMILPYIAGGQIMAIFLFKGFFDGLPAELFESARLDGAGHLRLYWHIVLPLSKQIIAVVAIINVLGVWNNWLWPFVTNSDPAYLPVASGLYLMSRTQLSTNLGAMYAAYAMASVPLLILFIYATKPFVAGLTSGAFKA